MINQKIGSDELSDAVKDILEDYNKDVMDATNKVVKKTASDLAKEIKANSPVRTGKYRSGWTSKQTEKGSVTNSDQYTVYNKSKPGLAHLLEHGHKKVVHGKVLGTTPARVHIAPAVDSAEKAFEQNLRKELKA